MNEHMHPRHPRHPRKVIPIKVVGARPESEAGEAGEVSEVGEAGMAPELDACSSAEPFALMVLGDSMEPEFAEGEIILVEPEGLATDGSFVMAELDGELIFRQLARRDDGTPDGTPDGTRDRWQLRPLNPAYPTADIDGLAGIKGVIIQKSKPGRRKASKRYVE